MKVIKIGAEWCPGCIIMRPRWAEIEKEHPWLETKYFDFDKDEKSIKKYKLEKEVLPIFIFLDKKGKVFLRLHGEPSKEKLVKIILENRNR
jgi:thiol-disulfide isomerase/thioredoxin